MHALVLVKFTCSQNTKWLQLCDPFFNSSARLVPLVVIAAARRGRVLPLVPVTLTGLPLLPSEM
jgi:hypothetical protein